MACTINFKNIYIKKFNPKKSHKQGHLQQFTFEEYIILVKLHDFNLIERLITFFMSSVTYLHFCISFNGLFGLFYF